MKNLIIFFSIPMMMLMNSCAPIEDPTPFNYELFVEDGQDQYPAFSPDGEQIVYYHNSAEWPEPVDYPSGLYLIDRDGSNRRIILPGQSYLNPDWSPDGEWIVFSAGGIIQKCKVNGDSLMTMQYEDDQYYFFPDFSPDGKFIIADRLVNDNGSLMLMKSDLSEKPFVFSRNVTTARQPRYSFSGKNLLYRKGSKEWSSWEIIIMNFTDSTENRITYNNKDNRDPSWSPDGQQIVWSQQVRIHIMNSDGSGQRFVTYGVNPSWSVHDEIVFSHANSDYTKEVLYTIKPDGSGRKQITN